MTAGMSEQVVAITGAGAGIGRAWAFAFVEAGARVVAAGMTRDSGYESVKMIEGHGSQAMFAEVDATAGGFVAR